MFVSFRWRHSWLVVVAALSASVGCDTATNQKPGAENCVNGLDDDGDRRVDCLDPKCFEHSACAGFVEHCDNNIDDNGDGKIDCADLYCAGQGCGVGCTCIGGERVFAPDGGSSTDGGVDAGDCVSTPWGTVRQGESVTAYSGAHAQAGQRCVELSEMRTCVNGTLSGTFAEAECRNYHCSWADAGAQFGAWYSEGDAGSYPYHLCQIDAGWSRAVTPPQPETDAGFCEWSGAFFPNDNCAAYGDATFRCRAPNWEAATDCPMQP